jgi:hypothetical protein
MMKMKNNLLISVYYNIFGSKSIDIPTIPRYRLAAPHFFHTGSNPSPKQTPTPFFSILNAQGLNCPAARNASLSMFYQPFKTKEGICWTGIT